MTGHHLVMFTIWFAILNVVGVAVCILLKDAGLARMKRHQPTSLVAPRTLVLAEVMSGIALVLNGLCTLTFMATAPLVALPASLIIVAWYGMHRRIGQAIEARPRLKL